jgi:hypothetical protein
MQERTKETKGDVMSIREIKLHVDSEAVQEILRESLIYDCVMEAEYLEGGDRLYCLLVVLDYYGGDVCTKEAIKQIKKSLKDLKLERVYSEPSAYNEHVTYVKSLCDKFEKRNRENV